jgi:hypothetical protein
MVYVMRVSASPDENWQYLKAYDPNGCTGLGKIDVTNNVTEAQRFNSLSELCAEWQRQGEQRGKAIRPLTRFFVETEEIRTDPAAQRISPRHGHAVSSSRLGRRNEVAAGRLPAR